MEDLIYDHDDSLNSTLISPSNLLSMIQAPTSASSYSSVTTSSVVPSPFPSPLSPGQHSTGSTESSQSTSAPSANDSPSHSQLSPPFSNDESEDMKISKPNHDHSKENFASKLIHNTINSTINRPFGELYGNYVKLESTAAQSMTSLPFTSSLLPSPALSQAICATQLRFRRRLKSELDSMPSTLWRSNFIDFIRLYKLIDKVIVEERWQREAISEAPSPNTVSAQSGSELSSRKQASSANGRTKRKRRLSMPESDSNPYKSRILTLPENLATPSIMERALKAHDIFWCVLKAEIDKVNDFFLAKCEECAMRLDVMDFKSAGVIFSAALMDALKSNTEGGTRHDRSPKASREQMLTFVKSLCSSYPNLASHILDEKVIKEAAAVNDTNEGLVGLLQEFFEICKELDTLRKFAVINYVIVLRLLRRYDRVTKRQSTRAFLPYLTEEPFFTASSLARLLIHAQLIIEHFVVRKPVAQVKLTCPLCHNLLHKPVLLPCEHRFCFDCIARDTSFGTFCPVCRHVTELDPHAVEIESVLTRFVGMSLTDDPKSSRHTPTDSPGSRDSKNSTPNDGTPPHYTSLDIVAPVSDLPPVKLEPTALTATYVGNVNHPSLTVSRKEEHGSFNDREKEVLSNTCNPPGQSSCHRCKSVKENSGLMLCTSKSDDGKKKKECRKKYCMQCLRKQAVANIDGTDWWQPNNRLGWQCPACLGVCSCAACQRKYKLETLINNEELAKMNPQAHILTHNHNHHSMDSMMTSTSVDSNQVLVVSSHSVPLSNSGPIPMGSAVVYPHVTIHQNNNSAPEPHQSQATNSSYYVQNSYDGQSYVLHSNNNIHLIQVRPDNVRPLESNVLQSGTITRENSAAVVASVPGTSNASNRNNNNNPNINPPYSNSLISSPRLAFHQSPSFSSSSDMSSTNPLALSMSHSESLASHASVSYSPFSAASMRGLRAASPPSLNIPSHQYGMHSAYDSADSLAATMFRMENDARLQDSLRPPSMDTSSNLSVCEGPLSLPPDASTPMNMSHHMSIQLDF